jgi:gentisate 1,2-dioxygenase
MPPRYPMLRYPWTRTCEALHRFAEHSANAGIVELDYVNPETGESCLPTLGFAAVRLAPGRRARAPKRSSSSVFHVVEGAGESTIDGQRFAWSAADTFSAPVFAEIEHRASGDAPALLVRIHDAPLQHKLGFYEEIAP